MGKKSVVKGVTNWEPYDFGGKSGFKAAKYDKPTCKVSKSTLSFYETDMKGGTEIRVLVSGNGKFGITEHRGSGKVLKANKSGSRVSFASKKLIRDLGLVDQQDQVLKSELPGTKETIKDIGEVWIFG